MNVAYDDLIPGKQRIYFAKTGDVAHIIGRNDEGRLMLQRIGGKATTLGKSGYADMLEDGYIKVLG